MKVLDQGPRRGDPGEVWDRMAVAGALWVEFCGVEQRVHGRLTVGRAGDLCIDDNPYLHRIVCVLEEAGGAWWLRNVGSRIPLAVLDGDGHSSATVGPGSSLAVVHRRFVVRFRAGPAAYELTGRLTGPHPRSVDGEGRAGAGAVTLEWGRVDLNDDQRLLLAALCEPRLRDPADRWAPVPSNRSVAARLGWTLAKFNRKLDHLCVKLARAGVAGVHGDLGQLATDRRRVLVEHALEVGLVGPQDLVLLEGSSVRPASAMRRG